MDQMPNNGLVNANVFGDGQHLPYDDNLFQAGPDQAFNDASWGLHASAYQQPVSRAASAHSVPSWPQPASHVSASNTPTNFNGQQHVYGRPPVHSPAPYVQNNAFAAYGNPNFQNFSQPQAYPQQLQQQNINPAFQQYHMPATTTPTQPVVAPRPIAPADQQVHKPIERSQSGLQYSSLSQQQPSNVATQAQPTLDQHALAQAIPASEQNGRFSIIDLPRLIKATNSERLTMYATMGKQPQEFPVNRSTALPPYSKRHSRNELKRLAKNDPKLQAKLTAKASLSNRSSGTNVRSSNPSSPRGTNGNESIKYESDSDSDSESDVSLYSDEEDDLVGAPLPSKRPEENAKGAVEYDTIKALWRNKRKTIDAASIRKGLGDFWEVVKTIRDRWKTDSKAVEEAEAKKRVGDIALLKSRVKDQRDMLEVAFRTALKHGFRSIIELFSENPSFLYLCYQFLLDRFKAEDVNGQVSRMTLEILSLTTSITTEKLEKTFLSKVLPRYVKSGDGKTKFYAKKILEGAANNGKSKPAKTDAEPTAGVKRSASTAGNAPANAPAKKAAIGASSVSGTGAAPKNTTAAKKPAEAAKASASSAPAAAAKTKTVQAKPTTNFFAGLQSAGKKTTTSTTDKATAKPAAQRTPAAPAPKPAFNLAETLANLAKPKEEPKKASPKPDATRDSETPERKAKRDARLARGAAGVRWKDADNLVEVRYFTHDPAEELDHDASQMRDVKDVGGEGRMLKQHADMMDVDEEEDSAEDDDESHLVAFRAPSEVDFATVPQDDQDRQYAPYGGGKKQPESPESAIREQYERDNLIVIYSDASEIPPNPREPSDPYNGQEFGHCKEFGSPPEQFMARANRRAPKNAGHAQKTSNFGQAPSAPAPALDLSALSKYMASQQAPQPAQQPVPPPNFADFMKQFQPQQTPPQQSMPNFQAPAFNFPPPPQQQAPAPTRANGEPDISAILAALNTNNTAQPAPPAPNFQLPPGFPMPPMPFNGAPPEQQQQHQQGGVGKDGPKKPDTHPYYKTKKCKYWQEGKCKKGDACGYVHG